MIAVLIFSVLLVSLLLIGAFSHRGYKSTSSIGSTGSISSTSSQISSYNGSSTSEYTYSPNVSPVYAQLGYPMLSYNGNSQYDPQKSNFTVEYRFHISASMSARFRMFQ